MDQQQPQAPTTSLFQMNLDAQNSYSLRSAASWAKVTGVVGVILGIYFVIMCAIAMSEVSKYRGSYSYRRRGFSSIIGYGDAAQVGLWVFILSGIIFILGGMFSWQFGNRINTALKSNDQQGLNQGFTALRNYYAIRSITLIVVLIFFFLLMAGNS
jgi:hypothetical protein